MKSFDRHRAAVLLALLAAAPLARAEEAWTLIASTATKKVLLQEASIRPHGEFVEAWTLYRFEALQTDVGKTPFRSSRYLYDHDCRGGRERARRVVSFNGPLEAHDLDLSRRMDWTPVGGPTTVSGIVHKRVCAKAR